MQFPILPLCSEESHFGQAMRPTLGASSWDAAATRDAKGRCQRKEPCVSLGESPAGIYLAFRYLTASSGVVAYRNTVLVAPIVLV